MTLNLRFWGTRGSVPTPGPHTVRYGGNTPCVEIRTATGALVILDAGTGLRELGRSLMASSNGHPISAEIFLTHAHWDHIQGIPFFAPIFERGNHFTIWGATLLRANVGRVVRDQMSPVVFPVTFDSLAAQVEFAELSETPHVGDGYSIVAFPVHHPGGALAYRVTDTAPGGRAFVHISDNELAPHASYGDDSAWRTRLVDFVRGATLLVHDATYTPDEYERHRGWGHSRYTDALELALDAGVDDLVLFHHKPERHDDDLDVRLNECRATVAQRGASLRVTASAEGMTLAV
jgi:phosphoribosyl 1,2-cyclic phosphodiesterase